jgi:AcrR family transcriptional regulator
MPALTFQALALRLRVSKQAIIYWFPSKQVLLKDIWVPAILAEVEATRTALVQAGSGAEAIELFLRSLITHHRSDLGRFRMMYLSSQLGKNPLIIADELVLRPIHQHTSSLYQSLESLRHPRGNGFCVLFALC